MTPTREELDRTARELSRIGNRRALDHDELAYLDDAMAYLAAFPLPPEDWERAELIACLLRNAEWMRNGDFTDDVEALLRRAADALRPPSAAVLLRQPAGDRPTLFCGGEFVLHGGARSPWKIDCDALTDDDLATVAMMLAEILPPFGEVEGVPRGGLRLAEVLRWRATEGPLLIVDDVLTTGASMEAKRSGRVAIGAVLFARGPCPAWVRSLFTLGGQALPETAPLKLPPPSPTLPS